METADTFALFRAAVAGDAALRSHIQQYEQVAAISDGLGDQDTGSPLIPSFASLARMHWRNAEKRFAALQSAHRVLFATMPLSVGDLDAMSR